DEAPCANVLFSDVFRHTSATDATKRGLQHEAASVERALARHRHAEHYTVSLEVPRQQRSR
ncbi:hypothetical protein NO135_25555, partial [Clostridioides difficile]|nr:hypothetical protein [Clostridioides difficile]